MLVAADTLQARALSWNPAGSSVMRLSGKLSGMNFGLMWVVLSAPAFCAEVYLNDFNAAPGTTYPEWTSSGYTNSANRAGTIAPNSGPQPVATIESPEPQAAFPRRIWRAGDRRHAAL
jgi:hypothetical protein